MNPTWPDALPCPSRMEHSLTFSNGRIENLPDAGPPSSNLRTKSAPEPIEVTLHLTRDQYAALRNFYYITLKGGTRPFWMRDVIFDGTPIRTNEGQPLHASDGSVLLITAMDLCMFTQDPPKVRGGSRRLTVSFRYYRLPI